MRTDALAPVDVVLRRGTGVRQRLAQSDNQATLGKQPGTAGLFLEAALRFPEAAVGGVLAGADAGDVIGGQCAHGNEALPG